ncbi:hypothetical protein J422_07022 [Methanocaldococcus villosus KIN24-T80]|uniref:tRNA 2-selenouridine synthase AAA domain-containing protein n=1 Tax=Methanocaldococcus villosus KIN24-T80 TaxID=1069083 RepID=N6VP23_9EURY|nr:selenouridine synthase SelU-like subunit [Methanocaldococcus villosus]ENN95585.1 hypothetical protein J422_07022 [Methanocaldococcus villosus KIN24-T80]
MIIFGLFGKTGCGKTEILRELKKMGHSVIDIEDIAKTKGSVLGDLYHLKMRSQEEFDKIINEEIKKAEKRGYVIVEYEGRKIGGVKKLEIPKIFAEVKNYNYKILIDCPYECQIRRLLELYKPKNEWEKEILKSRFLILKNSLKKEEILGAIDKIIELIDREEYLEAVKLAEERIYRVHYLRAIKKITPDLIVYNKDVKKSAEIIDDFVKKKLREIYG